MMMKRWLWLFLLLVGLLGGCRSGESPTPTPFPSRPALTALDSAPEAARGIPTTLADLLDNPEFFAGALVQVTGTFGRLPRLVCGLDPHPSPASWTLQDGEALIQAGGFDTALRELAPEGLTMTVVGRWQQWRGPVGCGKQAVVREIWFLEVTRLVSPAQIARVTLTPAGLAAALPEDEALTPTAVLTDTTSLPPTAVTNTPQPTTDAGNGRTPTPANIVTATATIDFSLPALSPTATITGATTLTPEGTPPPEGTPTPQGDEDSKPTEEPPDGASTPAATLPPGVTATPTPFGMSSPTPNGTPINLGGVDRGRIDYFDSGFDRLEANAAHNRTIFLEAGQPVNFSVLAEPTVNIAFRLVSPEGQLLQERNNGAAGQVENLLLNVAADGDYLIQVYAADQRAGRYFFSLWDEDGDVRPMGTLQPGAPQTGQISGLMIHNWFFVASAGDRVTIETMAAADSDLLLTLYDGEQMLLVFGQGEILNFEIPETDWYLVEVEEFFRDETDYQITLTRE